MIGTLAETSDELRARIVALEAALAAERARAEALAAERDRLRQAYQQLRDTRLELLLAAGPALLDAVEDDRGVLEELALPGVEDARLQLVLVAHGGDGDLLHVVTLQQRGLLLAAVVATLTLRHARAPGRVRNTAMGPSASG
ncbi:MAG: hypothetical protein QM820_32520 [Minicystis sp.]